ncbi:hypothetical protein [Agrococcus sp. TSP3-2-1]|uniref:hypothetical protein n=1 Tax=Agrococcus sp. TSP3-2-1 TaxID=2804583 RepID=UPI003CEDC495
MSHFLAAYVVPEPLLARWPADESDGMVKLNKERLLMERRHALKDAFRRGAWIEPRFDDLVGARVWEDIRGRPSLFGDPRAVTVYLEHLAGAGEAGDKTRQQTDILREVALRLYRKAALIATPLLSDAQFADVVASAVEEARGTRPTARETVSGGPLVDFIYQAATLGVDIEPALRFEAPSWGEVPALEDALRERAAELGATEASEIADLHLRLLARWRQLENELRRVALAGILHFLLEADGHHDARAGGLLDDLAIANLATQLIAAYTQSADINLRNVTVRADATVSPTRH